MDETRKGAPWSEIIVFGFSALGLIVTLTAALGLGASAIYGLIEPDMELVSQSTMLGAAAFIIGITLLPGAILNLQAITGWKIPFISIATPKAWFDILLVVIWLMLLIAGAGIEYFTDWEWFLLPPISAAAGILPIIFFVRIGLHGLPARPIKQDWDIYSLALTFGPLLIAIIEVIVIGVLALFALIIFASDTSNLSMLESFTIRAESLTEDQILQSMVPYLLQPWTIFVVISMFSIVVPIIEELLKPIGVWIISKRVTTPQDGFALGLISGAGYSVFESVAATSANAEGWALTAFTRAGTDALHMLNSALIGWALISAIHEKKYLRLAGAYTITILIHGLWNGLTIGMGFGFLAFVYDKAIPYSSNVIAAGTGGLITLSIVMILILIHSNRTLRKTMEQDNITNLPTINDEP